MSSSSHTKEDCFTFEQRQCSARPRKRLQVSIGSALADLPATSMRRTLIDGRVRSRPHDQAMLIHRHCSAGVLAPQGCVLDSGNVALTQYDRPLSTVSPLKFNVKHTLCTVQVLEQRSHLHFGLSCRCRRMHLASQLLAQLLMHIDHVAMAHRRRHVQHAQAHQCSRLRPASWSLAPRT